MKPYLIILIGCLLLSCERHTPEESLKASQDLREIGKSIGSDMAYLKAEKDAGEIAAKQEAVRILGNKADRMIQSFENEKLLSPGQGDRILEDGKEYGERVAQKTIDEIAARRAKSDEEWRKRDQKLKDDLAAIDRRAQMKQVIVENRLKVAEANARLLKLLIDTDAPASKFEEEKERGQRVYDDYTRQIEEIDNKPDR